MSTLALTKGFLGVKRIILLWKTRQEMALTHLSSILSIKSGGYYVLCLSKLNFADHICKYIETTENSYQTNKVHFLSREMELRRQHIVQITRLQKHIIE